MPAPLITIFNGRQREPGEGATKRVYAQVDVTFRSQLYLLKGAKLAVFTDLSLHANENGWSWPSRETIARETGYNVDTISRALSDLCKTYINGHRILLRHQSMHTDGTFTSNRYLIFPSDKELAQYESTQPALLQSEPPPSSGLPCTVEPCTVGPCTVEPCTVGPVTVNHYTNHNHAKQEPSEKPETAEKEEPAASKQAAAAAPICSIHHVEMTRRQKNGDVWYSHQTEAGLWCKGAPGDQPKPVDPHITDRRRYLEWDTRRYIDGEFAEFIQH